jgi:translation initiation factor 2B subunit (eIF-2B alpha/beta/delta family)
VLPGKIKTVSDEKNKFFKDEVKKLRRATVSQDLQNFIYFGDQEFKGLKTWTDFGEDKENSWVYKLESQGQSLLMGIESGKSVADELFGMKGSKTSKQLEQLNKHVEIVFDSSITHIEKEIEKNLKNISVDMSTKIYKVMTDELNFVIRQSQQDLSSLLINTPNTEDNYSEKVRLFKDYLNKLQIPLKNANTKQVTLDKKISDLTDLKDSLDLAYAVQDEYFGDILHLYEKLGDIDPNHWIDLIDKNLDKHVMNIIVKSFDSITNCFKDGATDQIESLDFSFSIINEKPLEDVEFHEGEAAYAAEAEPGTAKEKKLELTAKTIDDMVKEIEYHFEKTINDKVLPA